MLDDAQKVDPHMFLDKELKDIYGLKIEDNFVEVTCGCTSWRNVDTIGKLQIFKSGDLQIKCDCTPRCKEARLILKSILSRRIEEDGRTIYVMIKDKKESLLKTRLLKYYNLSLKSDGSSRKLRKRKSYHHDECVCCVLCKKERRFRIEKDKERQAYHDAQTKDWICLDWSFTWMTCDDKEERASRKALKGCPRTPSCKGCTTCFCFGCKRCLFSSCSSQIC
ncbi:hypothetical protein J5N97_020233 [Dioscorea zingiberensis]|uniref:Uncharacterized protein n=1 Tax=Dioscorea zingiberensis TaxID=325984 RepID=A0A9D5HD87_9LILI|nr:hypothetical protein J5N97_020233 [Dioscorea zingiberensis]